MTQVEIIRKQLLEGNTLTQRTALMDFGIMALPRRIADLKEQGFPIKRVIRKNPMTGQRYAQYFMDESVTNIHDLRPGNVYRIVEAKRIPFSARAFTTSQGYFTFRGLDEGSDLVVASITMGGAPQIFSQGWLDRGDFKIKYIGGMN